MTTWFHRLGARLGSLSTDDPFPEYSSMDARDGLARRPRPATAPQRRLVAVAALGDRPVAPLRRQRSHDAG